MNWFGEYMFEELERFAYAYLCFRKHSFFLGYGLTAWILSDDIWMEGCK